MVLGPVCNISGADCGRNFCEDVNVVQLDLGLRLLISGLSWASFRQEFGVLEYHAERHDVSISTPVQVIVPSGNLFQKFCISASSVVIQGLNIGTIFLFIIIGRVDTVVSDIFLVR